MKSKILLFSAALLFLAAASCTQAEGKSTQTTLLAAAGFQVPSKPVSAPDFSLQTLTGETRRLSDYRGKIVILNFWATWCPPCRAEMPSMEKIYGEFKTSGLEILAVDVQEDAQTVHQFIAENGYTFPVLLDTTGKIGTMYGARSIPTTYLLGRDGSVLGMTVGSREWTDEKTRNVLRSLMEK